jgi:5'-nucleotidase
MRSHTRVLTLCLTIAALGGVVFVASCGSSDTTINPVTLDAPKEGGGNVAVQILAINDFHGNLEPPTGSGGSVVAPLGDPLADAGPDSGEKIDPDAGTATVPGFGGAAYLAAHLKTLKATNPNTAIVSAGDLTGASPLLSNVFKDEPTVLAMNTIGLDFEGVGNHDFDRGVQELLRLQNGGCSLGDCGNGLGNFPGASFKYLAANVEDDSTKATVFPPYAVKDFGNGVKVAFIGMTLQNTPGVTVASAVAGLTFGNEVQTVNALLPDLKSQGVSAIVVLLHQGAFQDATGTYDSCNGLNGDLLPILKGDAASGTPGLDPAVDVLVSAHTHAAYDCTIDGRLVTSAASFGRVITKIDLTIDPVAHKVVDKHAKNIPVSHDVTPDPDVAALVAQYETQSAPLANKVVGFITADLTGNAKTASSVSCETPLGDVIADAQLAATSAADKGGADAAFMNPGGIRADLVAKAAGKTDGTVTYGEAFAVQPFANLLTTLTLAGADIATLLDEQFAGTSPKILQVSKNVTYSYTWDATAKKGTVDHTSIKIDGVALDMAKTYRVTVNSFLAGGGDGFTVLKTGTNRLTGMVDLDALVAFLGANSSASAPLAPPTLGRITGIACQ